MSHFDARFEAFIADTRETISAHHRVRYRVFCQERGFEDSSQFPHRQESDTWDWHAARFTIRDKKSGVWVAASRIVLPTAQQLPVEFLDCLYPETRQWVDRAVVGEVSRVCIIKKEERLQPGVYRLSDRLPPPVGGVARRAEPEILAGLIRAMVFYSLDNELPFLYMLITDAFARLLERLGVSFIIAGNPIEHRGERRPYLIDVAETKRGMIGKSPKVAAMYEREHLACQSMAAEQRAIGDIPLHLRRENRPTALRIA